MQQYKTAIVTDSACDLSDELLQRYGIRFVPLRLIYREYEKRDRAEISPEQVYESFSTEVPKTSLAHPEDVTDMYDRLAAEGYTDVVHISISSGLSGMCDAVRLVVKEYTRLKVHVVDCKSLSMQEGLIVLNCARLLEKTQDPAEIIAYAEALRKKSTGMFIIRTLSYLRKGGRIGLVEGVLGTVLQLKPVIHVNDDGVYETVAKARGFASAKELLIREFTSRFEKRPIQLAVVHGAAPEEGQRLLERLKALLNIQEAFLSSVSPALGVHTGPGLLGVIACEIPGGA